MLLLDNAAGSQVLSPILLKKELIGHILNLGGHLLFDGRKEVSPISSGSRSHLVPDLIWFPISYLIMLPGARFRKKNPHENFHGDNDFALDYFIRGFRAAPGT